MDKSQCSSGRYEPGFRLPKRVISLTSVKRDKGQPVVPISLPKHMLTSGPSQCHKYLSRLSKLTQASWPFHFLQLRASLPPQLLILHVTLKSFFTTFSPSFPYLFSLSTLPFLFSLLSVLYPIPFIIFSLFSLPCYFLFWTLTNDSSFPSPIYNKSLLLHHTTEWSCCQLIQRSIQVRRKEMNLLDAYL